MKKNNFLQGFGYILDYLPVIATVILATIASFLSARRSATTDDLLQWILLILALLATTQLVDRFRIMRGIDRKLNQIAESSGFANGANTFFIDKISDMGARIRQAKTVSIVGITLSRTTSTHWMVFKECLAKGTQIRIIVVDPEDEEALSISTNRFDKYQDIPKLKREIEYSLANLETLKNEPPGENNLQVRLLPSFPPYCIFLFDADTPKAEMRVQVYAFKGGPEPVFHLNPSRDSDWYNAFQNQFELMWDASRDWVLKPSVQKKAK